MPAAPVRAPVPVRVLVVDDDARVRAAIRDTIDLEADLLLVGSAAGAGDARAVAEGCAPFVALVDVLLPDEASGLELVTDLSRRPQCVVVAMSGRGAVRRSALAAGAVSFVEKGDDIEVLLQALRTAAGSPG